jgi:hypothetical protein
MKWVGLDRQRLMDDFGMEDSDRVERRDVCEDHKRPRLDGR